jgi:hypothetical protein
LLDLVSAKLFVFVNSLFANNPNLNSQIKYIIVLGNKTLKDKKFRLRNNILHWNSIKYKRVTRAVLVLEFYNIIAGINIIISIFITLQMIAKQLNLILIPTIVCMDSFLLYKYIIKLSIIKEKRLMINIIAIR